MDVGGTFTDLVLADTRGATWVAKVPSVPADPSRGVHAALARVAVDLGMPLGDVLTGCSLFVHGSTVATNTMLEGTGAVVGLIGTEGFRDTLEIRRGMREDQWNHRAPYAPVLVPRYLRATVPGRIDSDGTEHQPVDLSGLDPVLEHFASHDVEAVAIAFMNSFVNDSHERAAAEAVREQWDGTWVTTSAAVSPLMGEYERTLHRRRERHAVTEDRVLPAFAERGSSRRLGCVTRSCWCSRTAVPRRSIRCRGGQ